MEDRIKKLKIELAELIEWKNKHIIQQVNFPLDAESKKLIQNDLLVYTGVSGGSVAIDTWLEVSLNGRLLWIGAIQN